MLALVVLQPLLSGRGGHVLGLELVDRAVPAPRHLPACAGQQASWRSDAAGTAASTHPATRGANPRGGQAMVEFVVGLVAVLVIVAFIIQVGRIAQVHTLALTEARAAAAADAMGDVYLSAFPGPRYIQAWEAGPDGAEYSKDDTTTPADPSVLVEDILSHSHPQELHAWVPDNEFTAIAADPNVDAFALVHGHAEAEEPIEVLPVIRHLLYNADEIEVGADVWLTWTKGLY